MIASATSEMGKRATTINRSRSIIRRSSQNADRPGRCVSLADPAVRLSRVPQWPDRLKAYQPRSPVCFLVILRGPEDVFDRPPVFDIEHHDTHPIAGARKATLREIPR